MSEIKTAKEIYKMLGKLIKDGHGEEPFKISVPFRDRIGLHYEEVVNITTHEGIVDLHTTMPDYDDIRMTNEG